MAQTPGYPTTVKTGGTPTAFTNEPTTKLTANTVYQLTDATKQILDPDTAVVIEVDADGAGAGAYASAGTEGTHFTLNRLTGTVTFLSDQGASALVRFTSGSYIPLLSVAKARNTGFEISSAELDTDVYANDGWHTIKLGMQRAKGNLEILDNPHADQDPGGGTKKFSTHLSSRVTFLIEIDIGAQGNKFRAWAQLTQLKADAELEGLETTAMEFNAAGKGSAAPFCFTG